MASTVADNQALQGRHLSASFGLADDLSVAARSSSNQNGWAVARGLNDAFASVVADLDKMSVATGSLQTLADTAWLVHRRRPLLGIDQLHRWL